MLALKRQIEIAIVNAPAVSNILQNIPTIHTQFAFNADSANHLASMLIDFGCTFPEGWENFAIPTASDLDDTNFSVVNSDTTGAPLPSADIQLNPPVNLPT